jgi:glutaredoxin
MTTTKPLGKTIPKQETKTELSPYRMRDTDNNNAWTVIIIDDCEWCAKAVNLLEAHGENFKTAKLNHEWFRRLVVEYEVRKIPAIFLGNAYFGSYAELENYYKCSFVSSKEVF